MKQLPLYEQIYNDIIEGIENGTYKKGDRLPSEKELSEKYCVSRITSKKALELLEDDVCTTLLLTEGPTRAQDERVKEFAARHTKKLTCFDTKEYALPGISDEFRPLLSPVVMAAVLQRISKNIEVITDHSLDIRRYYRKESY